MQPARSSALLDARVDSNGNLLLCAMPPLRGRMISEPSEPSEKKRDSARVAITGKLDPKHLRSLTAKSLTAAEVKKLTKESHWKKSMVVSGVGAVATFKAQQFGAV